MIDLNSETIYHGVTQRNENVTRRKKMNVKISYNTLVYAGENIADGIRRLAKFGYDGVDFVGEPDQLIQLKSADFERE